MAEKSITFKVNIGYISDYLFKELVVSEQVRIIVSLVRRLNFKVLHTTLRFEEEHTGLKFEKIHTKNVKSISNSADELLMGSFHRSSLLENIPHLFTIEGSKPPVTVSLISNKTLSGLITNTSPSKFVNATNTSPSKFVNAINKYEEKGIDLLGLSSTISNTKTEMYLGGTSVYITVSIPLKCHGAIRKKIEDIDVLRYRRSNGDFMALLSASPLCLMVEKAPSEVIVDGMLFYTLKCPDVLRETAHDDVNSLLINRRNEVELYIKSLESTHRVIQKPEEKLIEPLEEFLKEFDMEIVKVLPLHLVISVTESIDFDIPLIFDMVRRGQLPFILFGGLWQIDQSKSSFVLIESKIRSLYPYYNYYILPDLSFYCEIASITQYRNLIDAILNNTSYPPVLFGRAIDKWNEHIEAEYDCKSAFSAVKLTLHELVELAGFKNTEEDLKLLTNANINA